MERLKWQKQRRKIDKIDCSKQEKIIGTGHIYFSNLRWLYFPFFLGEDNCYFKLEATVNGNERSWLVYKECRLEKESRDHSPSIIFLKMALEYQRKTDLC